MFESRVHSENENENTDDSSLSLVDGYGQDEKPIWISISFKQNCTIFVPYILLCFRRENWGWRHGKHFNWQAGWIKYFCVEAPADRGRDRGKAMKDYGTLLKRLHHPSGCYLSTHLPKDAGSFVWFLRSFISYWRDWRVLTPVYWFLDASCWFVGMLVLFVCVFSLARLLPHLFTESLIVVLILLCRNSATSSCGSPEIGVSVVLICQIAGKDGFCLWKMYSAASSRPAT